MGSRTPWLAVVVAMAATLCTAPSAGAVSAPGPNGRIYYVTGVVPHQTRSILPDGSGDRAEPNVPVSSSFSPDGRRIAFGRESGGRVQLIVRPLDDPLAEAVLFPRAGDPPDSSVELFQDTPLAASWSSDGAEIVVGVFTGGKRKLAVVPVDLAQPVRFLYEDFVQQGSGDTREQYLDNITFSPTQREVVGVFQHAVRGTEPGCGISLDAVSADSGTHRAELTPPKLEEASPGRLVECRNDTQPDHTPDGTGVVFVRRHSTDRGDGSGIVDHFEDEIRLVPVSGGAERLIHKGPELFPFQRANGSGHLENAQATFEPHVAPDGSRLAVLDATDTTNTSGPKRLVTVPMNQDAPTVLLPEAEHILGWVSGAEVTIDSAPSGLTRSRRAEFAFSGAAGSPPGTFECRFDSSSAGFTPCTSPFVRENLSDGSHLFEVRFVPNSGPVSSVRSVGFEVDATPPPLTRFTSGPSGSGNPSDATIVFESDEQALERFECSLDGGPSFACVSPHNLTGLAPGEHRFAVSAIDRAGNIETPPAELLWSVEGAPPPIALQCPTPVASAGVVVAIAREEAACWQSDRVDGQPVMVSRGVVSVNGVQVTPRGSTRLEVGTQLANGTFRTTGPVTIGLGAIQWDIDSPFTWDQLRASQLAQIPKAFEALELQVAGSKVVGVPSLELSTDNGGQAKFSFKLSLPEHFRATPGRAPAGTAAAKSGLTVEGAVIASNDRGVGFAGRITLAEAWLFGRVKVKDLSLGGDAIANTLDGTVTVELAQSKRLAAKAVSKDAAITAAVTIAPPDVIQAARTPFGALRKLSLQVSKFEKHLGEGFYLQRFGAELGTGTDSSGKPAAVIKGNVGLSFGPRLQFDKIFEGELLSIDGTGTLTIPTDDKSTAPVSFEAAGDGKLVDLPVTNVTVKIDTTPRVSFTARQGLDVAGFGLSYGISDGFFDPLTLSYNARGFGQIRVPGLGQLDAEVVQSSTGFAACAPLGDRRVGFGKRWAAPAEPFRVFSSACDIGPFTTQPGTNKAGAAGGGAAREIDVARGQELLVLTVRGSDGAPHVTLTGPRGERLTSPLQRRGVVLAESPSEPITYALVSNPSAGTWTVSGDGIARVDSARDLPPVRVKATLRRGRLHWKTSAVRGQKITFVERGAHTSRTIATTPRAKGSVKFTPTPSLDRRRRIEAVVALNGIPRDTVVVAKFTARPATAGKVTKLKRSGTRKFAWRGSAPSYAIAVAYADGTTQTATVTKRSFTVKKAGTAQVTVVPLGIGGRPGAPVRRSLKL